MPVIKSEPGSLGAPSAACAKASSALSPCPSAVPRAGRFTSSVCSWMCETRRRKGAGKEEECGECGDTNWLTLAALCGVRR